MKHDEHIDTMQPYSDDSTNQHKNANATLPIKYYPLKNIPLYHAHYHQHTYNVSNLHYDSPRNRSTIKKRASGEKQTSTNITMVLEDLLKLVYYEQFDSTHYN